MSHLADQATTVSQLLASRAATDPQHVVMTLEERNLTFAELDELANRMAAALQSLAVAPGSHCGIMLPNGLPFITAWFGSGRAGCVDVPVNVSLRGVLLQHQFAVAQVHVIVTDLEGLRRIREIADGLPDLRHVIVDGSPQPHVDDRFSIHSMETLLARAAAPEKVVADPRDPAQIMFTSGTTGPSKGVVRSHHADLVMANKTIDIMGYEPGEVLYTAFPLFHLNAKFNSVVPAMLLRGRVVLRQRFSASKFWSTCREEGVTAFNFMGAMLTILMKQPESPDDRDHAVRCAYGAPAPISIFEPFVRRFGVDLVEVWGSTELGIATHNSVGEMRPGYCGRPAEYYEVAVHDEDDLEVPDGVEGELCVRPRQPSVMFSGYHGMPEATLESVRNLWFHTGDRGVREDGYFRFVDRMKDSIRRRGENISSWEVERVILASEKVAEAAVIGVPSELTDEEVMAVIVAIPGVELAPEEILDHCQDQLPHFAVPRYVKFVAELPRTPSNRVEKYQLRGAEVWRSAWDREEHGYVVART